MDPRIHYANTSLIGNWYEDRLDESKIGKDPRTLRQGKVGETPIKMKRPVPDFYVTQCKGTFTKPSRVRPETTVSMVSMNTIRNHLLNDRTVPPRVYNAPLPRHGPDRDLKEFYTTHNSFYGGKHAADPVRRRENRSASGRREKISGMTSEDQAAVGTRGISGFKATGERLRVGPSWDPKDNTFVQRAWNYNREGSQYYTNDYTRAKNTPGMHFKGLGEKTPYDPTINYARRSDTIKHSTGIWTDI